MKEKKITCIVCPVGCEMKLKVKKGKIDSIEGYGCQRGVEHAKQEYYNPQRVLTTTVRVKGGKLPLIPVRTDRSVSRKMLKECMRYLARVEVKAPIELGQVVAHNILSTGVNVVSTRRLPTKNIYRKT